MEILFYTPYAEQNADNQECKEMDLLEIEAIFYVRRTQYNTAASAHLNGLIDDFGQFVSVLIDQTTAPVIDEILFAAIHKIRAVAIA